MQYADALHIIRETALKQIAETETVLVEKAYARVCAENVVSEIQLPPFTNSAVDGFAIAHGFSRTATTSAPIKFKISGPLFPGEVPKASTPAGVAWEVTTGAPVPLDCDACAKVEDTLVDGRSVYIQLPLQKNENLRFAGSDFTHGTRVISRGEKIRSEHLMALASVGRATVEVFKKPKILLLSTGKELIEPGAPLKDGEIYNSTRVFLKTSLENLGADVEIGPTMSDEPAVFTSFMRQMLRNPPDLLITTGAVSMGSADFVRPALEELGAQIIFHRVNVRPGKPLLFAKFEKSATCAREFVAFGLPGNPVSGVVGTRFFIETFLRTRQQQEIEKPFRAKLAAPFSKPNDLRCFFKAQLVIDDGEARVHLMKGQPSHMVRPLLQSSVWAVLREGVASFAKDDLVDVFIQESLPYDFSASQGAQGDFV